MLAPRTLEEARDMLVDLRRENRELQRQCDAWEAEARNAIATTTDMTREVRLCREQYEELRDAVRRGDVL